jgi:hypothetical protein
VKNRFQNQPFKCNLQRYTAAGAAAREQQVSGAAAGAGATEEEAGCEGGGCEGRTRRERMVLPPGAWWGCTS